MDTSLNGTTEPQEGAPLTAKDEAARDGVTLRTVYKRRALKRSELQQSSSDGAKTALSALVDGAQVNLPAVHAALLQQVDHLKGTVNQLQGQVNAQGEELRHWRDLAARALLPAPSAGPREPQEASTSKRRGGWLGWVIVVLLAVAVAGLVWWAVYAPIGGTGARGTLL